MASYSDRYELWVGEAERLAARKKELEDAIKRRILGERNRVRALGGRDTAQTRVDSAIINDDGVREVEKDRQRAVDRATMYGFGALIEQLRGRVLR